MTELTVAHLAQSISDLGRNGPAALSAPLGVAVSGGSDSVALLLGCVAWAKQRKASVHAITVDHGLRAEAAAEAAAVAGLCAELNVDHTVVPLHHLGGQGNLQAQARTARYAAIADWAKSRGLRTVAIGHTGDDVAETLLMRLARGAGVEGLAQMRDDWIADGVRWLRPLLAFQRVDLRALLQSEGYGWVDDPSNDDVAFARVRARKALAAMRALGVTADGLNTTARLMRQADQALKWQVEELVRKDVQSDASGTVSFGSHDMAQRPAEIGRQVRLAAMRWISGRAYAPRGNEQERLSQSVQVQQKRTLGGCVFLYDTQKSYICREVGAAQGPCPTTEIWDGRWVLQGPHADDLHIAALGEAGLAACAAWRDFGIPKECLLATPAVWRFETLVAAPVVDENSGWTAQIAMDFPSFLLTH